MGDFVVAHVVALTYYCTAETPRSTHTATRKFTQGNQPNPAEGRTDHFNQGQFSLFFAVDASNISATHSKDCLTALSPSLRPRHYTFLHIVAANRPRYSVFGSS